MTRRSTFFGGQGLDWDALRMRLAVAEAQLEEDATVSAEDARGILDERARILARPIEATSEVGVMEVMVFRIGEERYAVPLENVVEVARAAGITPLPGAERPVIGVTGWHGRVLTVLDVSLSGAAAGRAPGEESRILALGERHAALAVLASAVEDIRSLPAGSVTPSLDEPVGRAEYVRGMTNDAIVLLDVPALITLFHADT